jgi:hypothetical protein
MASSQEPNLRASRARRSVSVLFATAVIAVLSVVAVGSSSATADSGDSGASTTHTGSVIVECRSDVVTEGDVSMSAMSVTRVDAVPTDLPGGCRAVS